MGFGAKILAAASVLVALVGCGFGMAAFMVGDLTVRRRRLRQRLAVSAGLTLYVAGALTLFGAAFVHEAFSFASGGLWIIFGTLGFLFVGRSVRETVGAADRDVLVASGGLVKRFLLPGDDLAGGGKVPPYHGGFVTHDGATVVDTPDGLALMGAAVLNLFGGLSTTRIIAVMDMSTSHLPKEVCDDLNGYDGVVAHETRHGWLMYVPQDGQHGDEMGEMPEVVARIIRYAAARSCTYVLFDSDAGTVHDLPTFDW